VNDTQTLTISEFLKARYAEDTIGAAITPPHPDWHDRMNSREFLLEDIMSKRAIVDLHQHRTDPAGWIDCATCGEQGHAYKNPHAACAHLRLLAAPYRTHPDYQEEWA
jgi:hypothetical protein